ncbi:hypothetical protein FGADI_3594 [Fusarium gaditjirri]|uniref:Uncharacterized protein n=1 Tax=Fusarium gaditjirri TaxID=282569 RepID=A0A8H4TF79_9HYPO|nr:hypothetical protein FGADI_3594 [Fusarium gaditjirri]
MASPCLSRLLLIFMVVGFVHVLAHPIKDDPAEWGSVNVKKLPCTKFGGKEEKNTHTHTQYGSKEPPVIHNHITLDVEEEKGSKHKSHSKESEPETIKTKFAKLKKDWHASKFNKLNEAKDTELNYGKASQFQRKSKPKLCDTPEGKAKVAKVVNLLSEGLKTSWDSLDGKFSQGPKDYYQNTGKDEESKDTGYTKNSGLYGKQKNEDEDEAAKDYKYKDHKADKHEDEEEDEGAKNYKYKDHKAEKHKDSEGSSNSKYPEVKQKHYKINPATEKDAHSDKASKTKSVRSNISHPPLPSKHAESKEVVHEKGLPDEVLILVSPLAYVVQQLVKIGKTNKAAKKEAKKEAKKKEKNPFRPRRPGARPPNPRGSN